MKISSVVNTDAGWKHILEFLWYFLSALYSSLVFQFSLFLHIFGFVPTSGISCDPHVEM